MHDERRSQPENDWVQITEGLHAQKTGRIAGSYVLMEGKILLKIQFPTGETDYILQSKTTPCTEPQQ